MWKSVLGWGGEWRDVWASAGGGEEKGTRVWGEVRGGRGMGVRGSVLGCGGDMGEGVGRGERKGEGVEKCGWGMWGCGEVWGVEGR